MEIKSDIEIAQSCEMKNIREIAATAGVDEKYLEMYGNYKAKVDYKLLNETQAQDGKLILVTAITPTPAGAVSYTHLDVYKRQHLPLLRGGAQPPAAGADGPE